jgi:hypothetical protein
VDEIVAKIEGLLKSQQGRDAGFTEVEALRTDTTPDGPGNVIGVEHDGEAYFVTVEEA